MRSELQALPRRPEARPGVPKRSQTLPGRPGAPRRPQALSRRPHTLSSVSRRPRSARALPGVPKRFQTLPSAPRRSRKAKARSSSAPRRSRALRPIAQRGAITPADRDHGAEISFRDRRRYDARALPRALERRQLAHGCRLAPRADPRAIACIPRPSPMRRANPLLRARALPSRARELLSAARRTQRENRKIESAKSTPRTLRRGDCNPCGAPRRLHRTPCTK